MKAIAFVGFKKSGKTSTLEKVANELKNRGYKIAIAKSMHTNFDNKNTDTWKFKQVADYIIVKAQETDALLFEAKDINALFSIIPEVDFLLLEGFKTVKHIPKIICAKSEEEVEALNDGLAIAISGIVANNKIHQIKGLPVINALENPGKLADLIEEKAFMLPNLDCRMCGLTCYEMAKLIIRGEKSIKDCVVISSKPQVVVKVDGKELPMKDWVQELVKKTIKGMLSAMKGYKEGRKIEITINNE
ncbi:molybdopterin-guanine dinucleotide biosynthesis protein B [Thermococcus argininiproducens]|uniref:Molybdopterin-guanine dinucleotide biosynthesis protein B n=1 Tax=Thermococcus argininiproducens TaxID=2866384 RepID=A0A9E7M8C5_9EURY|nr:molybdopterin-guanine dinucleotide biosynthesis protein B [Thermococcus argininiproducens]USG99279.1 molybdopterin-guanine dinucleotide biosynthesis protein B [Thermococcus argininiproducens]